MGNNVNYWQVLRITLCFFLLQVKYMYSQTYFSDRLY